MTLNLKTDLDAANNLLEKTRNKFLALAAKHNVSAELMVEASCYTLHQMGRDDLLIAVETMQGKTYEDDMQQYEAICLLIESFVHKTNFLTNRLEGQVAL